VRAVTHHTVHEARSTAYPQSTFVDQFLPIKLAILGCGDATRLKAQRYRRPSPVAERT
jgi:hypothetical protein